MAAVRPNAEFAEAAERHLDDVLAFLVYLTGDRNVAEDLTAETFARALERWRRYDPRRGSARTWLCQLARSTALDHFRSEERRRRREGRYSLDVRESAEGAFGEGLSPELESALVIVGGDEIGPAISIVWCSPAAIAVTLVASANCVGR